MPLVRSGWLWKRGPTKEDRDVKKGAGGLGRRMSIAVGRNEAKKRRFFRLWETSLVYYKDDRVKDMKKIIRIGEIVRVDKDNSQGNNLSFQVVTRERTYRLAASHITDRNAWIAAIKDTVHKAMEKKRNGEGEGIFEKGTPVSPVNSARLADDHPFVTRARSMSEIRSRSSSGSRGRSASDASASSIGHNKPSSASMSPAPSSPRVHQHVPHGSRSPAARIDRRRSVVSSVGNDTYHTDMTSSIQRLERSLGNPSLQARFLQIHRPIVSAIFVHGVVMNVALPQSSVSGSVQSSFKQRKIFCSESLEWLIFCKVHADASDDSTRDNGPMRERRMSVNMKTKAMLSVRDIIRVDAVDAHAKTFRSGHGGGAESGSDYEVEEGGSADAPSTPGTGERGGSSKPRFQLVSQVNNATYVCECTHGSKVHDWVSLFRRLVIARKVMDIEGIGLKVGTDVPAVGVGHGTADAYPPVPKELMHGGKPHREVRAGDYPAPPTPEYMETRRRVKRFADKGVADRIDSWESPPGSDNENNLQQELHGVLHDELQQLESEINDMLVTPVDAADVFANLYASALTQQNEANGRGRPVKVKKKSKKKKRRSRETADSAAPVVSHNEEPMPSEEQSGTAGAAASAAPLRRPTRPPPPLPRRRDANQPAAAQEFGAEDPFDGEPVAEAHSGRSQTPDPDQVAAAKARISLRKKQSMRRNKAVEQVKQEVQPAAEPEPIGWTCASCTFLNTKIVAPVCEMCGRQRDPSDPSLTLF